MRRSLTGRTTADDVRRVALAALATALDDGKQQAAKKPGLTGVRAVATGAVIYTAGRAIFSGRRFIADRLGSDSHEDERDDEEYDEPEDEEPDEPEAEADEEPEDEDEQEPTTSSRRPPVHSDEPDPDLPRRPSRSRAPVVRA